MNQREKDQVLRMQAYARVQSHVAEIRSLASTIQFRSDLKISIGGRIAAIAERIDAELLHMGLTEELHCDTN